MSCFYLCIHGIKGDGGWGRKKSTHIIYTHITYSDLMDLMAKAHTNTRQILAYYTIKNFTFLLLLQFCLAIFIFTLSFFLFELHDFIHKNKLKILFYRTDKIIDP